MKSRASQIVICKRIFLNLPTDDCQYRVSHLNAGIFLENLPFYDSAELLPTSKLKIRGKIINLPLKFVSTLLEFQVF